MPLDFCNIPLLFQRLVDSVFNKELDKLCTVDLGDTVIFSATQNSYLNHVEWIENKLEEYFLLNKLTKYKLILI